MIAPEDIYILNIAELTKDLYRMGNATWPAFTDQRVRIDVRIEVRNGVEVVIANGNGFSAYDHLTPVMKKPGKKIWRIRKGASLGDDLVIGEDKTPGREGHYFIAPKRTMPLKKYLGALEELGMDRSRVELITVGV